VEGNRISRTAVKEREMIRSLRVMAGVPALLLLAGCEYYDKPRQPLPEQLEFRTLDGKTLRRSDLVGKPWVINLWVPG
jgi:hypothetical protein